HPDHASCTRMLDEQLRRVARLGSLARGEVTLLTAGDLVETVPAWRRRSSTLQNKTSSLDLCKSPSVSSTNSIYWFMFVSTAAGLPSRPHKRLPSRSAAGSRASRASRGATEGAPRPEALDAARRAEATPGSYDERKPRGLPIHSLTEDVIQSPKFRLPIWS